MRELLKPDLLTNTPENEYELDEISYGQLWPKDHATLQEIYDILDIDEEDCD